MRAHFGLPSVQNEEAEGRPPIQVKFEIPYFTVSGIQVSLPCYLCRAPEITHYVTLNSHANKSNVTGSYHHLLEL